MRIRNVVARALIVGAGFYSAPTFAQTFTVDMAGISKACSASSVACQAAVAAELAQLRASGIAPDTMNAQLGSIASAALTAASVLPADQRAQLAGIMGMIASASTNLAQIQALQKLASNLASGAEINLVAVASSLSQS